jgi:hypothetical protein
VRAVFLLCAALAGSLTVTGHFLLAARKNEPVAG